MLEGGGIQNEPENVHIYFVFQVIGVVSSYMERVDGNRFF